MAAQTYPNVYLEGVEAAAYTGEEPNQVWNQTIPGAHVGEREQGVLGRGRKPYYGASRIQPQPSQSRLSLPDGLLRSNAPEMRNRRMPNGTYGGVRGRKTEVGGKLTTFVFLLLDFR